ncbi:unnamed protein product, partial [Ceratitis capitata]
CIRSENPSPLPNTHPLAGFGRGEETRVIFYPQQLPNRSSVCHLNNSNEGLLSPCYSFATLPEVAGAGEWKANCV